MERGKSAFTGALRDNLAYIERLEEKAAALREAVYQWLPTELPVSSGDMGSENPIEPEQIAALYREIHGGKRENKDMSTLCTPDFARFCRPFAAFLPLLWKDIFLGQKEDIGEEEPFPYEEFSQAEEKRTYQSTTAYMQNGFTDRAWRQFSRVVSDMTAEYFSGYTAVCEEVYNGRCRYCILPVYTSADGQLLSFRKLIGKYDLKICLETEVETADEAFMRFALLRRRLREDEAEPMPAFVDISAVLPEEGSVGGLIAACETMGCGVTAVYTVPLEYADRTQEFCLTLRLGEQSTLAGLALFLEASGLRYTVVGMYRTV